MKSMYFIFLFVFFVYSGPLKLIINQDTIKTSQDSIVVYPDSPVLIKYGCNDTSIKNAGVTFGWGKQVNVRDTTNGFIYLPSKSDLNTRIFFTIALIINGLVYDSKGITFIIKDPQNGIINLVKENFQNKMKIEIYSYNALGRKLFKSELNNYQVNKQYHQIKIR
jgi:hypothetical protein